MTTLLSPPTQVARQNAVLLGIGTAHPPAIAQEAAAVLAEEFARPTPPQRALLRRIYRNSGIESRGTVLIPMACDSAEALEHIRRFYVPPASAADRGPTTAARMARYAAEAPPLLTLAARRALDDVAMHPADITHLITLSCTGFFAPGLDAALIESLQLSPDIGRQHLGFMGCHAAFNALAAAQSIMQAHPGACVLVASVELSTLHFAYGFDPEKVVANALFADGASAVVCGSAGLRCVALPLNSNPLGLMGAMERPGYSRLDGLTTRRLHDGPRPPRLLAASSLLLPDSTTAMTWTIGDHGFQMTLSAQLPALIAQHIRPWIEKFLAGQGLALADVRHFPLHPGGPKILQAAAAALSLPETALETSRAVLRTHGNMSSATLLFLLQHLWRRRAEGLALAVGFGPGLMAEALLIEF